MADLLAHVAGLVSPDYRMFEIRDYDEDAPADATDAIRDAQRHIAASTNKVIIILTADWLVPCHLDLHVHREQPAPPGDPWQGRTVLPFHSGGGVIFVSQVTGGAAKGFEAVDLGHGPGQYAFAVHHQGREEARRRADDIRANASDTDDTYDEEMALAGIERYLIHIWPVTI